MKTVFLIPIITVIVITLGVWAIFSYHDIYAKNCESGGGFMTGFLSCTKIIKDFAAPLTYSDYKYMVELFQKKYPVTGGWTSDRVDGARTTLISTNQIGDSITLALEENQTGLYPEIICEHKSSGKTERITENIVDYLQTENCFAKSDEKTATGNLEYQNEKQFRIPDEFSTGHKLYHIGNDGIRANLAEYFNGDSSIMLFYEYCNCTDSKNLFADKETTRSNTQILDVSGISVIAYPAMSNHAGDINDKYVFEFYYDGYRISLHTDQKLDSGLVLVRELLDFERNAEESTYQKEITIL